MILIFIKVVLNKMPTHLIATSFIDFNMRFGIFFITIINKYKETFYNRFLKGFDIREICEVFVCLIFVIYLFIYLFSFLFAYLFTCLFVCLFIYY